MAGIDTKSWVSRDGGEFSVRCATPADAETLLEHLATLAPELNLKPGDLSLTAAQERTLLAEYDDAPNALFLVAEADGRLAGSLTLLGGRRSSNSHTAQIGISVREDQRSRGVGSALLETAISWADESGRVARLEILSYETNPRARALYEQLGFQAEGVKRAGVRRDGEWIDVVLMALLVGELRGRR
jgi:RimJ/RimL family protein N-acetyltransferase